MVAYSPAVRAPSACFIAPVSVATSTRTVAPSSQPGVRQRVGQDQPPLGVGVAHLGGPPADVPDDVGRAGRTQPDTAFSAAGTTAVTASGSPRRAAASTAASTAAPPAMSVFMWRMPALVLIEMPPVSKVMPLPTSTGCAGPADGGR